jgi:ribose transport system ATP-binding protein
MTQFALNVEDVSVAYGATQALTDVNFSIEPGEIKALIGANGAGKSTLIKVLTGVTQPTAGTLWRNGNAYAPDSPQVARQDGIYAVFQELSIFPHLTVLENIFAGAPRTRGRFFLDQDAMRRAAGEALSALGHDIPLDTKAGDLSVSNQQIVEIVRATVNGARVLLLDEPTSSLNAEDRGRLFNLIRVLKSQGCAIVYISHFLDEVLKIADTYSVLRDGKVVLSGDASKTDITKLSEAMFGRAINLHFRRSTTGATAGSAPLLEVDQLSARGVHSASFDVRPGEILTVFGLVDCGATELLQAIFGLRNYRGSVRLPQLGTTNPLASRWRAHGMGMVAEERPAGLAANRTIAENLLVPNLGIVQRFGLVMPSRMVATTQRYINSFRIKCQGANQELGSLSGGNQQKVAVARLAVGDVDVILLSEPTRGVDIAARSGLWEVIDGLASQGKAVVIATTDIEEALALSDSVIVMRRGQLLGKRSAADTTPEELLVEATGGIQ